MQAGLHDNGNLIYSWEELLDKKIIRVDDNKTFTTNYLVEFGDVDYADIFNLYNEMDKKQQEEFKKYYKSINLMEAPDFNSLRDIEGYDFMGMNISRPFMKGLLVFPEDGSIEKLGQAALCDFPKLKGVILPQSLEEIDVSCFASSGIDMLTIPPNVREIKQLTFYNTKMKHIKMPDNLEIIDKGAFTRSDIKKIIYKKKEYDGFIHFMNSNKKGDKTLDDIISENTNFKKLNNALKGIGNIEIVEKELR